MLGSVVDSKLPAFRCCGYGSYRSLLWRRLGLHEATAPDRRAVVVVDGGIIAAHRLASYGRCLIWLACALVGIDTHSPSSQNTGSPGQVWLFFFYFALAQPSAVTEKGSPPSGRIPHNSWLDFYPKGIERKETSDKTSVYRLDGTTGLFLASLFFAYIRTPHTRYSAINVC